MSALIWLSYASLLFLGLIDNIRGPFYLEILTDMQVNATVGSLFFATVSFSAFVGSLTLPQVIGHKTSIFLLTLSCTVLSVGVWLVSLAPSIVWLLLACVLFGWGFGTLNIAQNSLVLEAAPVHRRRQLLSGLHSVYGLAALCAPLCASAFRWMGFGWRGAFAILAILPLLTAMVASRHMAVKRWPARTVAVKPMTREEWSYLILFSLLMSGYLFGELSISSRLVLWLRTEKGFSADVANYYLASFFLLLLVGRLIFTFLDFSRFSNLWILSLSSGLSGLAYALALSVHPGFFVLTGLLMAPFFPAAMDQLGHVFGAKGARALSFVLGFGSFSIVIMHVSLGWLNDNWGLTQALSFCAGALFLISVAFSQLTRLRSLSIMSGS